MFISILILGLTCSLAFMSFIVLKSFLNHRRLLGNGVKTRGVITKFDIIKGKNSNTYFPIIQFKTYEGIDVLNKPIAGYNRKEYLNAPKEVEIIYLDSNPKVFKIEGQKFDYSFLFLFILMLLGFPFIIQTITKNNPDWLNDLNTILKQYFK